MPAWREAARKGRISEMEAIFSEHMVTSEAQDALAIAIARKRPAALLCFEACAAGCHRRVVTDMIRTATECEARDL